MGQMSYIKRVFRRSFAVDDAKYVLAVKSQVELYNSQRSLIAATLVLCGESYSADGNVYLLRIKVEELGLFKQVLLAKAKLSPFGSPRGSLDANFAIVTPGRVWKLLHDSPVVCASWNFDAAKRGKHWLGSACTSGTVYIWSIDVTNANSIELCTKIDVNLGPETRLHLLNGVVDICWITTFGDGNDNSLGSGDEGVGVNGAGLLETATCLGHVEHLLVHCPQFHAYYCINGLWSINTDTSAHLALATDLVDIPVLSGRVTRASLNAHALQHNLVTLYTSNTQRPSKQPCQLPLVLSRWITLKSILPNEATHAQIGAQVANGFTRLLPPCTIEVQGPNGLPASLNISPSDFVLKDSRTDNVIGLAVRYSIWLEAPLFLQQCPLAPHLLQSIAMHEAILVKLRARPGVVKTVLVPAPRHWIFISLLGGVVETLRLVRFNPCLLDGHVPVVYTGEGVADFCYFSYLYNGSINLDGSIGDIYNGSISDGIERGLRGGALEDSLQCSARRRDPCEDLQGARPPFTSCQVANAPVATVAAVATAPAATYTLATLSSAHLTLYYYMKNDWRLLARLPLEGYDRLLYLGPCWRNGPLIALVGNACLGHFAVLLIQNHTSNRPLQSPLDSPGKDAKDSSGYSLSTWVTITSSEIKDHQTGASCSLDNRHPVLDFGLDFTIEDFWLVGTSESGSRHLLYLFDVTLRHWEPRGTCTLAIYHPCSVTALLQLGLVGFVNCLLVRMHRCYYNCLVSLCGSAGVPGGAQDDPGFRGGALDSSNGSGAASDGNGTAQGEDLTLEFQRLNSAMLNESIELFKRLNSASTTSSNYASYTGCPSYAVDNDDLQVPAEALLEFMRYMQLPGLDCVQHQILMELIKSITTSAVVVVSGASAASTADATSANNGSNSCSSKYSNGSSNTSGGNGANRLDSNSQLHLQSHLQLHPTTSQTFGKAVEDSCTSSYSTLAHDLLARVNSCPATRLTSKNYSLLDVMIQAKRDDFCLERFLQYVNNSGASAASWQIVWALLSRDDVALFDKVVNFLGTSDPLERCNTIMANVGRLGLGFWVSSNACMENLNRHLEAGFKSQVAKLTPTTPIASLDTLLLWSILCGKAKVYGIVLKNRGNEKLGEFLTRDFQVEANQCAAVKNAYVLISQRRHLLACGFLILAKRYRDAADVLIQYTHDYSLAMLVAKYIKQPELVDYIVEAMPDTRVKRLLLYKTRGEELKLETLESIEDLVYCMHVVAQYGNAGAAAGASTSGNINAGSLRRCIREFAVKFASSGLDHITLNLLHLAEHCNLSTGVQQEPLGSGSLWLDRLLIWSCLDRIGRATLSGEVVLCVGELNTCPSTRISIENVWSKVSNFGSDLDEIAGKYDSGPLNSLPTTSRTSLLELAAKAQDPYLVLRHGGERLYDLYASLVGWFEDARAFDCKFQLLELVNVILEFNPSFSAAFGVPGVPGNAVGAEDKEAFERQCVVGQVHAFEFALASTVAVVLCACSHDEAHGTRGIFKGVEEQILELANLGSICLFEGVGFARGNSGAAAGALGFRGGALDDPSSGSGYAQTGGYTQTDGAAKQHAKKHTNLQKYMSSLVSTVEALMGGCSGTLSRFKLSLLGVAQRHEYIGACLANSILETLLCIAKTFASRLAFKCGSEELGWIDRLCLAMERYIYQLGQSTHHSPLSLVSAAGVILPMLDVQDPAACDSLLAEYISSVYGPEFSSLWSLLRCEMRTRTLVALTRHLDIPDALATPGHSRAFSSMATGLGCPAAGAANTRAGANGNSNVFHSSASHHGAPSGNAQLFIASFDEYDIDEQVKKPLPLITSLIALVAPLQDWVQESCSAIAGAGAGGGQIHHLHSHQSHHHLHGHHSHHGHANGAAFIHKRRMQSDEYDFDSLLAISILNAIHVQRLGLVHTCRTRVACISTSAPYCTFAVGSCSLTIRSLLAPWYLSLYQMAILGAKCEAPTLGLATFESAVISRTYAAIARIVDATSNYATYCRLVRFLAAHGQTLVESSLSLRKETRVSRISERLFKRLTIRHNEERLMRAADVQKSGGIASHATWPIYALALGQDQQVGVTPKYFVSLEHGLLPHASKPMRNTFGNLVTLEWSSDDALVLADVHGWCFIYHLAKVLYIEQGPHVQPLAVPPICFRAHVACQGAVWLGPGAIATIGQGILCDVFADGVVIVPVAASSSGNSGNANGNGGSGNGNGAGSDGAMFGANFDNDARFASEVAGAKQHVSCVAIWNLLQHASPSVPSLTALLVSSTSSSGGSSHVFSRKRSKEHALVQVLKWPFEFAKTVGSGLGVVDTVPPLGGDDSGAAAGALGFRGEALDDSLQGSAGRRGLPLASFTGAGVSRVPLDSFNGSGVTASTNGLAQGGTLALLLFDGFGRLYVYCMLRQRVVLDCQVHSTNIFKVQWLPPSATMSLGNGDPRTKSKNFATSPRGATTATTTTATATATTTTYSDRFIVVGVDGIVRQWQFTSIDTEPILIQVYDDATRPAGVAATGNLVSSIGQYLGITTAASGVLPMDASGSAARAQPTTPRGTNAAIVNVKLQGETLYIVRSDASVSRVELV